MPNPYHNAKGEFCSSGEMKASINQLAREGKLEEAFKLESEYNHIKEQKRTKTQGKKSAGTPKGVLPKPTSDEPKTLETKLGIQGSKSQTATLRKEIESVASKGYEDGNGYALGETETHVEAFDAKAKAVDILKKIKTVKVSPQKINTLTGVLQQQYEDSYHQGERDS